MKKYALFLWLIGITITTTSLYYFQFPRMIFPKILAADTPTYVNLAAKLGRNPFALADPVRLPGYPLLILFMGQNLYVTAFVQLLLFMAITLEVYALCLLLFQRPWLAFVVAAIVGSNPLLSTFFGQIMSECLACFLLTTTILLSVYFLQKKQGRILWWIGGCLFFLFFTRPEWIALPPLLFAFLYFFCRKEALARRIITVGIASCALIYVCAFGYVLANSMLFHFTGLSSIPNINLFGKILQYRMEDETSEKVTQMKLDRCILKIDRDPYHVIPCIPEFGKNYATQAEQFSLAIVKNHPVEFFMKTVPLFFSSLVAYFDPTQRSNSVFIENIKFAYKVLYMCNIIFPACVCIWMCGFEKLKQYRSTMFIIMLIASYGVIITTLAGYDDPDYMRFHTVFLPLIIITNWSLVLLVGEAVFNKLRGRI